MDEMTLREVVDRQQITELIHTFCKTIDTGETSEIVELFTEDGIDDLRDATNPKTVQHGREAIKELYDRRRREVVGVRMHCASNLTIELDGDTARASWCVTSWHWRGATPGTRPANTADVAALEPIETELRRTPAGWRIARQAVHFRGFGLRRSVDPPEQAA